MGTIRLSQVPVWRDPRTFDPDDSVPIGRVRVTRPITLTNILISKPKTAMIKSKMVIIKPKTVEFGGEADDDFQLWNGRPLEIDNPFSDAEEPLRLMTMEVTAPAKGYHDHTVIMSYRPFSLDWFGWSDLKRVDHDHPKSIRELFSIARKTPATPEVAIWSALTEMKSDPFGNEEKRYARLRLGRTSRMRRSNGGTSPRGGKANRAISNPELSLAICREFQECRDLLKHCDLLTDALERAAQGFATQHDGSPLRLTVTASELAPEIMEAAILKALAGVNDKEHANLTKDRRSSEFGTVAVQAYRVFHDDIRNLFKRTKKESRITFVEDSLSHTAPADYATAERHTKDELEEEIQKMREDHEKDGIPPPGLAWAAIMKLLNTEHGDEKKQDQSMFRTLAYTAALSYLLPMPDHVINRLRMLRTEYPVYIGVVLGPPLKRKN